MQFIQSKSLPTTCLAIALAVSGVIGCDDTDTGSRGVSEKTRAAVSNVSGLKSLEPSADVKLVTEALTKAADTDAGPAARAVAASTAAQVGLQSATAAANKLNAQANDVRRTLGELQRLAGLIAGNAISAKGYTAGDHKGVITNLSEQITKMQGNAQSATWGEPPTLPTVAAAKQEIARLQGEIDTKQQQLDGLTKKRNDALSKAEVQTKHAEGLKGAEAVRAYADASGSKKEGDAAAIDIDLVTVQLDRLKTDLASIQSQEKIVDTGIATLNNEGKLLESNWGGRRQFASKQSDLAKLIVDGDPKNAKAPSIKSLAVQLQEQLKAVAETRQAAFEQLTEAEKYAGLAKTEAEKIQNAARPKIGLGGKEGASHKSLVDVVHPQRFQYQVALAQRDTGTLSVSGTSLLSEVKVAVDSVKNVITTAGLTVPDELEKVDIAAATTLATEAADKLKTAVETFNNVEGGDSPDGVKTAAKGAHLIALFAHLNLLDIRKAAGDASGEASRAELHSSAIGLRDELATISKDAVPPLPGELGTPPAAPTTPGGEATPPATQQQPFAAMINEVAMAIDSVTDAASARSAVERINTLAKQNRDVGVDEAAFKSVQPVVERIQQKLRSLKDTLPEEQSALDAAMRELIRGVVSPAQRAAGDQTRNRLLSGSKLKQIALALTMRENTGQGKPATLDELVKDKLIEADVLDSPMGDAAGGDFVLIGSGDPQETVLLYDAAALAAGGGTNVTFVDGSVRWVEKDELAKLNIPRTK